MHSLQLTAYSSVDLDGRTRHFTKVLMRVVIQRHSFLATLQEQVYFGKIQDSDEDMLEAVLRTFEAAPKYNPGLLQLADASDGSSVSRQVGPHLMP